MDLVRLGDVSASCLRLSAVRSPASGAHAVVRVCGSAVYAKCGCWMSQFAVPGFIDFYCLGGRPPRFRKHSQGSQALETVDVSKDDHFIGCAAFGNQVSAQTPCMYAEVLFRRSETSAFRQGAVLVFCAPDFSPPK